MANDPAAPRSRRRRIWLVVVLLAAIAVAVGAWCHAHSPRDFAVVREGVLYRGGQPDLPALRSLQARQHIHTIVNLRGQMPTQAWWATESEFCRASGIRMIDIPIGAKGCEASGLKQFLSVATDPACQPVFVHCEHGKARTGYAVAAYRIAVEHWSYDDAINEALRRKFDFNDDTNRCYGRVLKLLADGADWHADDQIKAQVQLTSATATAPSAATSTSQPATAPAIRHVFLAVDESRQQVLYVNQLNPSKDWTIKGRFRDIQLIGQNKILLSTEDGYREYSLETRAMSKEVGGFAGAMSARRLADGRTLLACDQDGVTVYELDRDGKPLRKANFKTGATRLVRLTPQGTFLYGTFFTSDNKVVEGDFDGKIVRSFSVPGSKGAYHALRKPDGNLLLANGYDAVLLEIDPNCKIITTFGGLKKPELVSLGLNFFAGMQVLKNGDIVVANWTGHGATDSAKGVQIVQFDRAGKVVWTWHDPARVGSIDGVIVLDDLDLAVLNDDISSVLGP